MRGPEIEFRGLTKRFGAVTAVEDLSFTVRPGVVTGFLGPNGAGKTTTLRMLLGLVRPSAGTATIGGVDYRRLPTPIAVVGAALEATSFHPGRTARDHLRVVATAGGIHASRVGEVLRLTGIEEAADRRVGGYSLGMRQRLGLAAALLGDPVALVLDEPINGLDPEGIRWIRSLLRILAAEGRTVLVSSHLLSEVQQTVDEVVILARGRLVHQGTLEELESRDAVVVDAPDRLALAAALAAGGLVVEPAATGWRVRGAGPAAVGAIAQRAGIALSLLRADADGLEDVFLALTGSGAEG